MYRIYRKQMFTYKESCINTLNIFTVYIYPPTEVAALLYAHFSCNALYIIMPWMTDSKICSQILTTWCLWSENMSSPAFQIRSLSAWPLPSDATQHPGGAPPLNTQEIRTHFSAHGSVDFFEFPGSCGPGDLIGQFVTALNRTEKKKTRMDFICMPLVLTWDMSQF